LPELLEAVALEVRQYMFVQVDGAPADFADCKMILQVIKLAFEISQIVMFCILLESIHISHDIS